MTKFYKPRKHEQAVKNGQWRPKKNRLPRKYKKKIRKLDAIEEIKYKSRSFKRIPIYEILLTRCRAYNYRF